MQTLSNSPSKQFTAFASNRIYFPVLITELIKADAIVIFGNKHHTACAEMAKKAARLYKKGYAPRIIICGGVTNENGEIEAHEIRKQLVALGIPPMALLVDAQSSNTKENIVNARRLAERSYQWPQNPKIIGIGQIYASRRMAMTMAKQWPRALTMTAPISTFDRPIERWQESDLIMERLLREAKKTNTYLEKGDIAPINDAEIARKIIHAKARMNKPRRILKY